MSAVNPFSSSNNSNILSYTNLVNALSSNPTSASNLANAEQANELNPQQVLQDIQTGQISYLDLSTLFTTEEDNYAEVQLQGFSQAQLGQLTQYMNQNGIQSGDYVTGLETYDAQQLTNNSTFQQLEQVVGNNGLDSTELEEAALDPSALSDPTSSLYQQFQSQGVLSVFQGLIKDNSTATVQQALNLLATAQQSIYTNWQSIFSDVTNEDPDEQALDQEDQDTANKIDQEDAKIDGGLSMVEDDDGNSDSSDDDTTGGSVFGNEDFYTSSSASSGS